jgi:BlaI family transcriptional regulator, penicillinase repressor
LFRLLKLTDEFVREQVGKSIPEVGTMPRKTSPQPTEVEMAILRVLWDHGPRTVREVHDALRASRGTGYSTTLKMMQVMFQKGLLVRDESRRPQVYRPTVAEELTQTQIVRDLIRRVFGGSARKLVLRAVEAEHVSPDELAEIRRLLKQKEGGKP